MITAKFLKVPILKNICKRLLLVLVKTIHFSFVLSKMNARMTDRKLITLIREIIFQFVINLFKIQDLFVEK